jgi:hypothetical protein
MRFRMVSFPVSGMLSQISPSPTLPSRNGGIGRTLYYYFIIVTIYQKNIKQNSSNFCHIRYFRAICPAFSSVEDKFDKQSSNVSDYIYSLQAGPLRFCRMLLSSDFLLVQIRQK